MTDTTAEAPKFDTEKFNTAYEGQSTKGKAVMRFGILIAQLLKDAENGKCDTPERRDIRSDLLLAALRDFTCDIECSVCELMLRLPGKYVATGVAMFALRTMDEGKKSNMELLNILDLYDPEGAKPKSA